jgi:hypothetical protein
MRFASGLGLAFLAGLLVVLLGGYKYATVSAQTGLNSVVISKKPVGPVPLGSTHVNSLGLAAPVVEPTVAIVPAAPRWPRTCSSALVPAVYPNSSPDRSLHMRGIIERVGACGLEVDAVMRDNVAVVPVEGGGTKAVYQNETIMFTNGKKLPSGNVPNAASHMRMLAQAAIADGLTDSDWVLIFEDDAQLHAKMHEDLSTPKQVADMIRWSFQVCTRMLYRAPQH